MPRTASRIYICSLEGQPPEKNESYASVKFQQKAFLLFLIFFSFLSLSSPFSFFSSPSKGMYLRMYTVLEMQACGVQEDS